MTRIEGMLLERMTVRRWCVAVAGVALLFGAGGYFAGREHVKAELRDGFRTAVVEFGERYAEDQKANRQTRPTALIGVSECIPIRF